MQDFNTDNPSNSPSSNTTSEKHYDNNPEMALTSAFIRETHKTIYLTGKAGTGKTTFLRQLQDHAPKRMVVAAPTGVAAINARGVTLHSLFQLPFTPFIPNAPEDDPSKFHRFSRDKLNIIRSLELLVIDEISMVRADTLDAIDYILRKQRRNSAPFGGIQLLMIGDLHQLPPVVKREEQALLSEHYETFYFFGSHALQQLDWTTIELKKIYRQSDERFISVLNQVRDNALDQAGLTLLNSRYQPSLHNNNNQSLNGASQQSPQDHIITLTSHNQAADQINRRHLEQLSTPSASFTAVINDDFPSYAYPTPETMTLKVGAQVMFARNDLSTDKRYFNGKIGTLSKVSKETVTVHCPGETPIVVEPVTWENIKYGINEETNAIEEQVVGTFTQIPLKLAWAITIHKSQGLTFDAVKIDAAAAFSHGQVYVALSRCRRLEGITLSSPIPASAIKTDHDITRFAQDAREQTPTPSQLHNSKIAYQQQLVQQCFDFNQLQSTLSRLVNLINNNRKVILFEANEEPIARLERLHSEVAQVGIRFQQQLNATFTAAQRTDPKLPETQLTEENQYLQERVQKAHRYFDEKLQQLESWLNSIRFSSDNKELKRDYKKRFDRFKTLLRLKRAAVSACKSGFQTKTYLQATSVAQIEAKSARNSHGSGNKGSDIETLPEYNTSDIQHPKLLQRLSAWRAEQAKEQSVAAYQILHQRIIIQLAATLPTHKAALKKIKGVGPVTVEKYGETLLGIIDRYCKEHHVDPTETASRLKQANEARTKQSNDDPAHSNNKSSRQNKPGRKADNTKQVTLKMYQKGMSIDEIAAERGYVRNTIESHLAYAIEKGELKIETFIDPELRTEIEEAITQFDASDGLKPIKEILGDRASYGEIKMVIANLAKKRDTL